MSSLILRVFFLKYPVTMDTNKKSLVPQNIKKVKI